MQAHKRVSKLSKKKKAAVAAASVLCLAAAGLAVFLWWVNRPRPVISGVQAHLTVYADDAPQTIRDALLAGVTAADGDESFAVDVRILSPADGAVVEAVTPGEYKLLYYCVAAEKVTATSALTVKAPDTTPPTISGAKDQTVRVNGSISYRDGVTATDDTDGTVALQVDSSAVDLTKPGAYKVVYSASDSRGNTASVTVTVTVEPEKTQTAAPAREPAGSGDSPGIQEKLDSLCAEILDDILTDGMTDREKAEAIYNRVRKIKYVATTPASDWRQNAYNGLTTGRGDCVQYSAASRALLTAAGIPNYELQRYGGKTDHYWEIVYVDGGWYHFDACPTSSKYPIRCFLLTEDEVVAYSNSRTDRPNYYIYDHSKCPYEVVQSR
ncbi:MAG TPA: transglutaminase domain-containing protein [Candidatus Fimenecus excrementigallinarum]|uniref:Transglutaminase domain-containing protein n=1 Tax=Candidatus Fimenecus excrementigallinarum TaxID=2840816 RepID=A0A9D1IFC5_9FIRM|nr:transglutaminase domain-containing protein [Candidatus Fimenecus excrementigallinarum]